MEIQISSIVNTLVILYRFDSKDDFSATSMNDLIADVDSVHAAVLENDEHTDTLVLVKALLKAFRDNSLLTDGTSFVDKE